MTEKRKKESIVAMNKEGIFILLCTVIGCCMVGIFFKLVLGRTDWWEFAGIAIFPSFLGTIVGLAIKISDNMETKIKLFNPFKRGPLRILISMSLILSIIMVFITCVIGNMEWWIVTSLVLTVSLLVSELTYVLTPIWKSLF